MPTFIATAFRLLGVKGLTCIALGLALAVAMWRADAISGQRDRARQQVAQMEATSKASQMLAERQKAQTEARYRELAERASDDHEKAKERALAAAGDLIARNRLHEAGGNSTGSAPAASEGSNPGTGAGVPADSLVAVSEPDVQACSLATAYALTLREWALSLEAAGE